MKFTHILLLLVFITQNSFAQKVTQGRMDSLDQQRIAYIEAYKDLAVWEMYKSGIPASITLAQGLLETGAGTSYLARTANNHFGMKCGDRWNGDRSYKHDDEYTNTGDPLKSCFRSYSDPSQNFSDHSDFLRDPQKHNRYGALFLLDPLDYVAWSTGLQASGYSPVGHYSARLIEHIERYRLHELDYRAWDERRKMAARNRIVTVNGVQLVRAVEGETLAEIAFSCGVDMADVLEFNENHWTRSTPLVHGTPIFIQEKKKQWEASDLEFYFSHEGKSVFEISQLFGIKEAALRQINGLTTKQEPALKAKVRLKGQRMANENVAIAKSKITSPVPLKPKNKKPPMVPVPSEYPISYRNTSNLNRVLDSPFNSGWTAPVTRESELEIVYAYQPVSVQETDNSRHTERTVGSLIFHDVVKGETLMSISRKYGIPVADIRKLNKMISDNIQTGQRIRVK